MDCSVGGVGVSQWGQSWKRASFWNIMESEYGCECDQGFSCYRNHLIFIAFSSIFRWISSKSYDAIADTRLGRGKKRERKGEKKEENYTPSLSLHAQSLFIIPCSVPKTKGDWSDCVQWSVTLDLLPEPELLCPGFGWEKALMRMRALCQRSINGGLLGYFKGKSGRSLISNFMDLVKISFFVTFWKSVGEPVAWQRKHFMTDQRRFCHSSKGQILKTHLF